MLKNSILIITIEIVNDYSEATALCMSQVNCVQARLPDRFCGTAVNQACPGDWNIYMEHGHKYFIFE